MCQEKLEKSCLQKLFPAYTKRMLPKISLAPQSGCRVRASLARIACQKRLLSVSRQAVGIASTVLSGLIKQVLVGYRLYISPYRHHRCRFYPTCSTYCLEQIQTLPLGLAIKACLKRLLSCHPWAQPTSPTPHPTRSL